MEQVRDYRLEPPTGWQYEDGVFCMDYEEEYEDEEEPDTSKNITVTITDGKVNMYRWNVTDIEEAMNMLANGILLLMRGAKDQAKAFDLVRRISWGMESIADEAFYKGWGA